MDESLNKKEFIYTRHDHKQFHIVLSEQPDKKYAITSVKSHPSSDENEPTHPFTYINYSSISFPEQKQRPYFIQLQPDIRIDSESFYNQVELAPCTDSDFIISVNSIYDYIYVINIYNCISTMVRVYSILSAKENLPEKDNSASGWITQIETTKALAKDSIEKMITHLHLSESGNNGTRQQEAQEYSSLYKEEMDAFIKHLEEHAEKLQAEACSAPYRLKKIWDISIEFKNLIAQYHHGNLNNFYCRGVGKIIYPEIPGIFRGNRKHEEDRFYRTMKASFPEEFHNLKYLDRLAKMQHYELPTRMLDITSNPLVALYMTCNTIYTGDPQQIDYGEVILYFNHQLKSRSYDSKTMLVVAALVKLSYVEKTAMFKFLMMLEQYFSYKSIQQKTNIHEYINTCVHIAADRGIDACLTHEEKYDLIRLSNHPALSNAVSPFDFCWACLPNIRRPSKDSQWRRLFSTNSYVNDYDELLQEADFRQMFEQFVSAYEGLLLTVRRENPAFQNKIDIFTLLKSYPGQFGMSNPRIQAQAGGFILAGLDHWYINDQMLTTRNTASYNFPFHFPRIIIKDKKEIYRQLQMLNINDATLLPDLTHKAHYLDNQI